MRGVPVRFARGGCAWLAELHHFAWLAESDVDVCKDIGISDRMACSNEKGAKS